MRGITLPEQHFRGKVDKFILTPICSVLNEQGEVIDEKRLKPIQVFSANETNLKKIASELEETLNDRFFSKLETTEGK